MSMLARCAVPLSLLVFVAGCASSEPPATSSARSSECRWNPDACMYEGAYEPGEKDYAEQEARRLNQAAIQKLRRGRW